MSNSDELVKKLEGGLHINADFDNVIIQGFENGEGDFIN
jgi:hypothetical protein